MHVLAIIMTTTISERDLMEKCYNNNQKKGHIFAYCHARNENKCCKVKQKNHNKNYKGNKNNLVKASLKLIFMKLVMMLLLLLFLKPTWLNIKLSGSLIWEPYITLAQIRTYLRSSKLLGMVSTCS